MATGFAHAEYVVINSFFRLCTAYSLAILYPRAWPVLVSNLIEIFIILNPQKVESAELPHFFLDSNTGHLSDCYSRGASLSGKGLS